MDNQTNIQFEPMPNENNNIQIFSNPQFGEIRTTVINGEPWFVGKDVAERLGYSNPQKAIRDHVDEEDRTVNESFIVNGTMATLINESGLYSLVLRSNLPTAKQFKRWVTSEVLPSIRKHGAYLPNLPDFNDPAAAARAWADEVDAKRAALQQLKDTQERNKLLEPKAAWTDHQIGNDEMLYGWEQAAKHLKLRSAKKLTTFCLDHEFVFRRYDSKNKRWDYFPHAKFTEQGYFRVIQETPKHRDGTPVINQYTGQPCNPKRELKITEYGLVFLQSQLEKAGLVKPVFNKDEQ